MKKLLPSPKVAAIVLFFAALFPPTSGFAKSWTGANSSDWTDPGNWDPVGVPTASDEINFFIFANTSIVIPTGTAAVAEAFDVLCLGSAAFSFTIESGASLTLNSAGTIGEGFAVRLQDGSSASAVILIEGDLVVEEFAAKNIYLYNSGNSSFSFTNTGNITVHDCSTYGMHVDVANSADPGASIDFVNQGTIDISDGSQYAMYLSGKSGRPSSFTNQGILKVQDMSYIAWANSEGYFTQTASGQLEGIGIIRQIGPVSLAGTIRTTSGSLGQISLEDGSTMLGFDLSNVTLEVSAEGTAGAGLPFGNDHLNVTTNATLGGLQVNVSFDGGFTPSNGDSFDFITVSGTITGSPTFNLPAPPPGTSYNMVSSGGVYTLDVGTAPFPVEWISFEAEQDGNSALLSWKTASELNNEGFTVQRSTDGLVWEALGFVDGQGNSQQIQSYQFRDYQAKEGPNLYRLQQWDHDGQVQYSNVIELTLVKTLQDALLVYPVPASDRLTVEGVAGSIQLVNSTGQIVNRRQSDGSPEVFDVADLPGGLYYVQVNVDSHKTVHARWVKQ